MAIFAYGRCSTIEQTTENQRLEIEAAGHAVDYWFAGRKLLESDEPTNVFDEVAGSST
jgi:DNA invertase Pin-like site-specific DNA recombinase